MQGWVLMRKKMVFHMFWNHVYSLTVKLTSLMFTYFLKILGGGLFSPVSTEMIQFDQHIFQLLWNHRLGLTLNWMNYRLLNLYYQQGLLYPYHPTAYLPTLGPQNHEKWRFWAFKYGLEPLKMKVLGSHGTFCFGFGVLVGNPVAKRFSTTAGDRMSYWQLTNSLSPAFFKHFPP